MLLSRAGAFWLANLVSPLTPSAADYRSSLSIAYLPMLVQAGAGGLLVAAVVHTGLQSPQGRVGTRHSPRLDA